MGNSEYEEEFLNRLHFVQKPSDLFEAIELGKIPVSDSLPRMNSEDEKRLVGITTPKKYPDCLLYSTKSPGFTYTYQDWVSQFSMLNELFMLENFNKQLVSDELLPLFHVNTVKSLQNYHRWDREITVADFNPSNKAKLFRYQNFTLNRAAEKAGLQTTAERLFFWGWGTGTGKSFISAAGTQELFNRDLIDLALVFTMSKLKINLCRNFTNATPLNAVVNEGGKSLSRDLRHEAYLDPDAQVFVMNYEKANFDLEPLLKAVKGKRVLFVFDEVQKILTAEKKNLARKGIDQLIAASARPTVWPMSASIVNETPERYRDVYELDQSSENPLGSKKEFHDRFGDGVSRFPMKLKNGYTLYIETPKWDKSKLHEVRHIVASRTQSVRKTDPEVRDNFKGMQTVEVSVQLSPEDRKLYDIVKADAEEAHESGESLFPFFRLLRFICNSSEALKYTDSEYGQQLAARYPKLVSSKHSAKMEMFIDQVEGVRDAGDKIVAFTQWTHCSLFLIEPLLQKRHIAYVPHHGGMKPQAAQKSQDDFKTDPDVTLFLSSDAGAYGLDFPEARYVANYECPYSYDILMQRSERINRASSYLDGLTNYVYVTEDTIEQGIWAENNRRRQLASATTGTKETLTYGVEEDARLDNELIANLIFGDS